MLAIIAALINGAIFPAFSLIFAQIIEVWPKDDIKNNKILVDILIYRQRENEERWPFLGSCVLRSRIT